MNPAQPGHSPPTGLRPYRLTGQGAFEAIFRTGRRTEGRHIQLISVPATVAPGRAGLVVGRKALPRAVDRNRLKRLLREMLRAARPQACALDLVIRVKRPLRQADLRPAAEEAGALLARILATSSTR